VSAVARSVTLRRALRVALAWAALNAALPAVARPAAPPVALDRQAALQIVRQARDFEDHGAYWRAIAEWRRVRTGSPLDGDLELAIALDEARAGLLDSAAVRLAGPVLSAAALDTLPVSRYRNYTVEREGVYLGGRFEGWHWYVWRARAEVAAALGRWNEATAAARRCVAARPLSGTEQLLLAVCAGRAGLASEARAAARAATSLDPTLPEAQYLAGLWAWRDGRRAEAQTWFRSAVAIDSTLRPAAVALVRSRLPGAAPDSLPTQVLTGERAVGMLTSTVGPKLEEFVQDEEPVSLVHRQDPDLPDSLRARMVREPIPLWLFVSRDGRVVLQDLPWSSGHGYPTSLVAEVLKHVAAWRFQPAKRHGEPQATWVALRYALPQ
jgi:tetratricopeptide (TPR) repeat protein